MRLRYISLPRMALRWLWVPVIACALAIVIAMGCALFAPAERGWALFGPEPFKANDVPRVLNPYEYATTNGWQSDGFGVTFYIVSTQGLNPGWRPHVYPTGDFLVGTGGYPFRCLSWTFDDTAGASNSSAWLRGLATPLMYDAASRKRRLPLMPEPVGLLLNVLVYSVPALVIQIGWRFHVVRRRRRKNLCMVCAYPVASSTDCCPECGGAYAGSASAEASHA